MFIEDFEELTKPDQAIFRTTMNNILYNCFIIRRVYSKTTHMNKINSNYLFIERHFELFVDYVSYMGMDISKDDENGVIFISSTDDSNRIRLDGITTLIVYALRSYYESKMTDNPSINQVYMDSTAIKVLLKELGLTSVTKRISGTTIASSLRTLALYNIVVIAQHSFSEVNYAFYILPSIRYVISNAKLNVLYNSIKDINDGKDTVDDDAENTMFKDSDDGGSEE